MRYDHEAIGRRLRSGCVDKGMTLEDMANKIGVTRETVSAWSSGKSVMSFESAIKICEVLDWPLDRLALREDR